ncbi:HAD-like domain-containing protein, partial [Mycena crocata]
LAFAFDIDGVLIHGPSVLPEAKRALAILNGHNKHGIKIPYILMTNGGGLSEENRCVKLSKELGVQIHPSQLVQSHTILRSIAHEFADEPVLVLGGVNDSVRKVAEGYGYKQAYNSLDVHASNPRQDHAILVVLQVDLTKTRFRAVLVFCDPRNWGLDIQIMIDVLRAKDGVIGAPYLDEDGVKLVFCNPDLLWRNDFPRHRFGQGVFKEAFQAVFKTMTGRRYPYTQYGKPTPETYRFATTLLLARGNEMGKNTFHGSMPRIYMICLTILKGANAANWESILVHTGVYDPSTGQPPAHRPTVELKNVEEAVKWAMQHEGVEL